MNNCLGLCDLLHSVSHGCEKSMNAGLTDLGMSHCQARLLLGIQAGNTSVSDLSALLCCNKSNVTQVIDGLAKRKLLARVASRRDGRMKILRLTEKGKAACKKLERIVCHCADDAMSVFSPSERSTLLRLLKKYEEARHVS